MLQGEQEDVDKTMAAALGITYQEFLLLELHTIDEKDGVTIITFDTHSNPDVLKKVGVDAQNSISIPSYKFD